MNETSSHEYSQVAETEMARIVFKLMDVTEYKRISKVKFRNFLTENPNLIDLFDMLEVNTKKGKALKIENYLGSYLIFDLKGVYPD